MAGLDPNGFAPPKPRIPRAVQILRRYEEADAKAEAETLKDETLADPGFWESALDIGKAAGGGLLNALGAAIENSPFAGVPETLGGLASYPAEGLARLTGAGKDGQGAGDFRDMDTAGAILNLNPVGLIANAVGVGTGNSDLRLRGREFWEKASRGLAVKGPSTKTLLAATNPFGTAAVLANEGAEAVGLVDEAPLTAIGMGQGGKTDEFIYRMGLETAASGPLNIAPAGGTRFVGSVYNAAKASKAGAWMIERFPRAALLPERAWLKVSGANKKAAVLGDEQMQRLYVAQQAFEDESAPAFMRLYQDILTEEKGRYAKLNLAPAQEQAVRGGVLELAEQPADWRKVYAARMSDQQVVQDALVEMADLYGDQAARIAALENKYHIATKDLVSDLFEYAQRRFSPELQAWTMGNPSARQILTGTKRRLDVQQFETAWAGFERARKLGDMDINAAEAAIRADLRKAGLPENIPIFSRDAFGDLAKRAEADIRRSKVRNLYVAAQDVFGQSADQQQVQQIVAAVLDEKQARAWRQAADAALGAMDARDARGAFRQGREEVRAGYAESAGPATDRPVADLVNASVRGADKGAEAALKRAQDLDPAKWSPEVKAQWVATVVKRAGIEGPPRSMSALELLQAKKVPLPDNLDDLTRLATTFIDDADATKLQKYIEDFYSRDHRTSAFGRYYDGLKQIYQRSVLARPASLTKDLIGTSSQGFIAGNTAADLAQAVADLGANPVTWAKGPGKGYQAPDDVLRLMAEGVLQTTKEEALAKGAFEGVPVLGRVEERGLLGAFLPQKAGEKVAAATDSLLSARVWYEQTHRLATYRRAIREGMDHRGAVEEVYKHFGQFNELTKLERTVLNRMLFFWTWMARSVPVAIRNLLDHPIRSRILLTLMAHGEQGAPEWFNRMGGYVLGTDDKGNVDAIGTGGSTYFSPLFSLLQGDAMKAVAAGDAGAAISGAGMDVMRAAPPFVQGAGEFLQRQDYFTGEKWEDEQGQSNVKAPMAFWWLMNHEGEPNAVEKMLGLTAKTGKDGTLRGITIKPELGWLMQALPGVDVFATDVSAFVDPRFGAGGPPNARNGESGTISPGKGFARQAGFPVYRWHKDDAQEKNVRDFRKALHKEVGKLSGGGLDIVYGRVSPTFQTLRGQKINHDMAIWRKEAQQQGLGQRAAAAYVDQRMARLYQQEWRLMDLDRRLQILQQAAKPDDQGDLLTGLAG